MSRRLSVIYKVQDNAELPTLKQSLQAVPPSAETVVIVHESVDAEDIAADIVVSTDVNSLTAGRNLGAKRASRPYFAFMDADAIPGPLWAERIMHGFTQAEMAGGPLHPMHPQHLPDALPKSFHWLVGCGPYYDDPRMVANTYGSNFAISRDAFITVDGFREDIGMGSGGVNQGAETDLARRVRQAGYKGVWYDPDGVVYHTIPSDVSWQSLCRRAYKQGQAKAEIGVGSREGDFVRDELLTVDGGVKTMSAKFGLTGCVGAGYLKQRVMA